MKTVFRVVPQPCKPEYRKELSDIMELEWEEWDKRKYEITADWFGDYDQVSRSYDWFDFQKGKHITWQQMMILLSVEKATRKKANNKISISSGHGIGKSSCISWVILWFLFINYDAQVPCTAPTATQMHDVLWKELSIWIDKMPKGIKEKYDWNKDYIRMTESPNTWFARAKTSSKENSEALAGVHANHVLTIADEASGVEEQIFNTAEGAWTSGNILVILISNPTRINGYFYDTHHKLKDDWQTLIFSSIESPIVDKDYESKIAKRHGRDSQEYGIRVLGKFPKEDSMDDSGYVSLLTDRSIGDQPDFGEAIGFQNNAVLGVDPSGDGDDKTSFVLRDHLKAKKLFEEGRSNSKTIAEKIITFVTQYDLDPQNVVVDAFGVGMDVAKEVAIATKGRMNVSTVNVGDESDWDEDKELYINKRAEAYYKMKKWFVQGGEIIENKNMKEELTTIKYKRNIKGKIQIMPKEMMKKKYGYKSPNDADALSLTFLRDIPRVNAAEAQQAQELLDSLDWDPYSVI